MTLLLYYFQIKVKKLAHVLYNDNRISLYYYDLKNPPMPSAAVFTGKNEWMKTWLAYHNSLMSYNYIWQVF